MQLALTEEEAAFREEMRTFFTTKIPQEIRDTIAAGGHVGKDGDRRDPAHPERRRASPYPTGRSSGAARTGLRCSGTSGTRRCSSPVSRRRWRSTPT